MPEVPEHDHDPTEVAAAEALDREIDAVLAGRTGPGAPQELTWLSAATRTDPPPGLAARVEARHERDVRRRWRPVRYAAVAVAYFFVSQGIGNLVAGDWVAEGIGEAHSPHLMREGGFALIAVGLAVLAGAIRRQMLPVSVVAGVPLALAFGVAGIGEVGVFAAGAVLHLTQGVLGIVLAVTAWRFWRGSTRRRDTPADPDEGGA